MYIEMMLQSGLGPGCNISTYRMGQVDDKEIHTFAE